MPPSRPIPTRVVFFIDAQNLYYRCSDHFGWPWVDPLKLARELVDEDRLRHGPDSRVLTAVRYYTGIHDANRRPQQHGQMDRRLQSYAQRGVLVFPIPLRYDAQGRAREKGVDVRIGLDLVRLGYKGLFDVAVIVSEDSDLDEAAKDIYDLRDQERWIAVENALPWGPNSHTRWLPSVRRRRVLDQSLFSRTEDRTAY